MKSIHTFLLTLFIITSLSFAQTEIFSSLWSADHGWHVFDVCFSPDGSEVLAVEGTVSLNSVKLFNASDGILIWQQSAAAEFCGYCPDMSKIIIAGASVLALNPIDGTQIWLADQSADCIDISPDGSKIVIGKEIDRSNGIVVMLNSADGSKIWEGTTKGPVNDIKFSADGSRVISGGGDLSDREAILWNSENGSKIWTYKSGPIIYTVSISPEGDSVIVGTDWQVVTMLNATSGEVRWTKTLTERFLDSGFTPDGNSVFLSSNNGYVRMFDSGSGGTVWEKLIANSNSHKEIKCSPDGTKLVTGSGDKHVNVFDAASGSILFRGEQTTSVVPVAFSYDGSRVVSGTYNGGKVTVWLGNGLVDVHENNNLLITDYVLKQNYPNPFNPETVIEYSVPEQGHITLKVLDGIGKEVANLVNESKMPGNYNVKFNASNLSSGIYFYVLKTGGFTESKKMLLLK